MFIPNHKSYVDYMILFYLFYSNNIEVPSISTKSSIASITFIGKWAKKIGYYYMRDKKKKDHIIYKAILHEYIHILLKEHNMLEFFIEG